MDPSIVPETQLQRSLSAGSGLDELSFGCARDCDPRNEAYFESKTQGGCNDFFVKHTFCFISTARCRFGFSKRAGFVYKWCDRALDRRTVEQDFVRRLFPAPKTQRPLVSTSLSFANCSSNMVNTSRKGQSIIESIMSPPSKVDSTRSESRALTAGASCRRRMISTRSRSIF